MRFISLGAFCDVAAQIRRFTKDEDALFFDWLITPSDSYKAIFYEDEYFFKKNNWEIIEPQKIALLDRGTNLRFQHEFQNMKDENIIDSTKVDSHLSTAKEKFLYLKRKTLEVIKKNNQICLIRSENLAEKSEIISRINHIRSLFQPINQNIKVLLVSNNISYNEKLSENNFIFRMNKVSDWAGDNDSWDEVFKHFLE
jgi:hypothetical protein